MHSREGQVWRSHSPHGRAALRNASAPCGWEMAIAPRLGATLSSASTGQHPAAAHRVVPYVREGSPGSGPWGGTAARPESDRGTSEYQEPQVARARASHISCIP